MLYLEELIPQQKLFRFDYLQALKALLPRGKMWQIPLPIEDDISRVTIPSAEGFGVATLSPGNINVQPQGIASGEAVSSGLTVGV